MTPEDSLIPEKRTGLKKQHPADEAPPKDLREEWEEENIDLENREPNLEEIEEDSSEL